MNIALVYTNSEANVGRGVGYILGALEAAGHRVGFFDTHGISAPETARQVAAGAVDLLMVSTMTLLFPQALEIIGRVKAEQPLPVLLGGVHPTVVGPAILEEHPEIDYLCVGEGETMVTAFCDRWGTDALFSVPNLAYRRQGRVVANPLGKPDDLSALPAFPWHRFSPDSVVQRGQGFLYVTATRGCPYNCTYCCNGVYLNHYGRSYLRYRPVGDVVEELAMLQRTYRPGLFYFGDEMILADPAYAGELFTAISRELGVSYGCMIRVEHATEKNARMLKETGCRYVAMGIECGDEVFRHAFLNRKMTNAQIIEGFRRIQNQGIFTTSFNMIGYPVDHDDALTAATYEFNRCIGPDYAQVSIFYPFPGTRLYDYCIKNDLVDAARVSRQGRYYEESVLKDRSVQGARTAMMRRLNPHGFRFGKPAAMSPVAEGMRMALKATRYLGGVSTDSPNRTAP